MLLFKFKRESETGIIYILKSNCSLKECSQKNRLKIMKERNACVEEETDADLWAAN